MVIWCFAIRTGGHPHIFYVHFPDARWGAAPDREHHGRFFWQGTRPSETKGVALVAWRTVCHLKSLNGLGIRHPRHTNMALLTKWVSRIMQQSGDLAVVVLRGCYDAPIDSALWLTPRRRDSAFMQELRPVFIYMQSLFQPRVGNGTSFSFWEVGWSSHKRFRVGYPRLHALALKSGAMVQTVWEAGCFPSLPNTLSDQRHADLIALYIALVLRQLSERDPDAWVCGGGCFSVRAVYRHIQELESISNSLTLFKCCRFF